LRIVFHREARVIKETVKDAETRMKSAIQNLEDSLATIRTGRASPALVEKMPIDYYGSPTPLMQLATISVPEPRASSSTHRCIFSANPNSTLSDSCI